MVQKQESHLGNLMRIHLLRVLGLAAVALFPLFAAAASFRALGDLPGGSFGSGAFGVSADGSVVVGFGSVASGDEAFRWTSGSGMVGLGSLGGTFGSYATGVSADGTVVVGDTDSASGGQAFRWTSGGGMVGLGDLAGEPFNSAAWGVSADGLVVVGVGTTVAPGLEAFRWTSGGGMVGLGFLPGSSSGGLDPYASAVSANGAVVVGASDSPSGEQAFRWISGGGMVALGDLPGGGFGSDARAVSADGATVVGFGSGASGPEAFRWTSGGGMVGLGFLPGGTFESFANGVSADGTVVVGLGNSTANGEIGGEAFVWTQSTGMQRLLDVLVANGATVPPGWDLIEATAISANGQWVVGRGMNPNGDTEAFLANIAPAGPDADSDGAPDATDNCTLVANALTGDVPGTSPAVAKYQLDSDNDGFGNRCDGDFNNTGAAANVNTTDYSILRSVINKPYTFSTNAARADLNGDGTVNTTDYSIFRSLINKVPGPSGYACAGTIPCP